ncbi:DUF2304 domain-containing protein [Enterococcus avium]|uniref:DUF2304 domain-containing protein n=1 Tax=Enterococcus avium TaxID=33945 RepID=UPI003D0BF160
MMPVQLQIIAILLAAFFFILTIKLIRGGHAETRQMIKWLILAVGLLVGALFPKQASSIAHFLGIANLTSLTLFALTFFLLVCSLISQIELINSEKKIKKLTQELSLLKKEVYDRKKE